MAQQVTYYATKLSPNISETPEGYVICRNVPICRSGFQEYLGRELMKHSSYRAEWNLDADILYRVYRPKDEVSSPATIASFEGKPVADEHPPEAIAPGSLITLDNEEELGRGHMQNVRLSPELIDDEVVLLADLFLKNNELIEKVIDQHRREVSCGYTYSLNRAEDGTLFMSNIRGNHVAVVVKGRAGSAIAIGDAAPEIKAKEAKMANEAKKFSLGRLLKRLAAADAEPEELEAVTEKFRASAMDADEEEAKKKAAADKAAKDAEEKDKAEREEKERKAAADKAAKDAEEKEKADKEAEEKAAKDAEAELEDVGESAIDAEAEEEKKKKEAEEEEERKKAEKDKAAKDAEAVVLEPTTEVDKKGKAAIDSMASFLRSMKPTVARIAAKPAAKRSAADQAIVDSYNAAAKNVRELRKAAVDNGGYSALVAPMGEGHNAVVDSKAPQLKSPSEFFAGVPYAEGQKRYNEYLESLKK